MADQPRFFDTVDSGAPVSARDRIEPWKRVPLDPDYSGAWVALGDINGDGRVEVVSARNVDRDDVHYTSAVVAQDLAGRVLWTWGDRSVGRRGLHHDVACQIHDWDGDGRSEVVLCADGFLVELDGATGRERRRLPLPPEATDSLVFADLSGRGYASDVLVKTRYSQIWAFDYSGRMLWTVEKPGGFPTAHQPVPVDIDGDGRDEILAGYVLLNPDGSPRWTLDAATRFEGQGHLDCCRVLRRGRTPEECRLVLTCCGHRRLLAIDGNGRTQWALGGHHFESIDIGRVHPRRPGPQILVDVVPYADTGNENAVWLVDEDGDWLGRISTGYSRFHTLVDWNGDGLDEIVLSTSRGLFDSRGERIGTFVMERQEDVYGGRPPAEGEIGNIVLGGDFNGDGIRDVAITAPFSVCLFRNPAGRDSTGKAPLGTGRNVTLY